MVKSEHYDILLLTLLRNLVCLSYCKAYSENQNIVFKLLRTSLWSPILFYYYNIFVS